MNYICRHRKFRLPVLLFFMKHYRVILFFLLIVIGSFLVSCTHANDFVVKDFHPFVNWNNGNDKDTLFLDYNGAIENGFVIPSVSQTAGGKFLFRFSLKNVSGKAKKFKYKIYYQNESYKMPEEKAGLIDKQNPLSLENFYGSWEDPSKAFASSAEIPADEKFHIIQDSIRIIGNPRNEKIYYGALEDVTIRETQLQELISYIKTDANWFGKVKENAHKANRSIDQQLRMDALWVKKEEKLKDTFNNRWQRNPRVGKYSFILVVTTEEQVERIPGSVANINVKNDGTFDHPYYYFLFGKGKNIGNVQTLVSKDTLKVAAHPDLNNGIYVNSHYFKQEDQDTTYFREDCGNSKKLYSQAPFQQYTHFIDPRFPLDNIPVVADVEGNGYTVTDYTKNMVTSGLIKTPVKNSCCPCKTVHVKKDIGVEMTTPGSLPGEWKKENVGLITRHGFTYGKYIVKVKMPELLNKSGLWNGLTNAIWLLSQNNRDWNLRRTCKSGYIPKEDDNKLHPIRKESLGYSEIDFEILKASHFWPATSYPGRKDIPKESAADADNVMVTYTNWDMACHDVKRFTMGADSIEYKGKYYSIHRWDQFYKALTGKYAIKDDEVFGGPYFYFEIEWKPTEIIWRIGPEKNNLHTVGYVNETVSSIPNNQMLLVFTQEFHDATWWPGSPFIQDRIPFPAKDIIGNIMSIEIE